MNNSYAFISSVVPSVSGLSALASCHFPLCSRLISLFNIYLRRLLQFTFIRRDVQRLWWFLSLVYIKTNNWGIMTPSILFLFCWRENSVSVLHNKNIHIFAILNETSNMDEVSAILHNSTIEKIIIKMKRKKERSSTSRISGPISYFGPL
jgi:hypothetical protein